MSAEKLVVNMDELTGDIGRGEDEKPSNPVRVEVISQMFELTVRRIQQLTQEGILPTVECLDENGRKARRYDLIPTMRRYVVYLQEKTRSKGNRTEKEIELKEQKLEADIALRESQGELHRLKTAIAAGDYISVEEVRLDYAKFFVIFKKFAMSLPARIGGMLSGALEPLEQRRVEKEISGEIAELLNSFVVAGIVKPKDVRGIISGEKKNEKVEEEV